MQGFLHPQQPLSFLLGELYHRHAGPARDDFRNFPLADLASDSGVLFLPAVLFLLQAFRRFLLLVPQPGRPLEVLFVHRGFLFLSQPLDLFLQIFQIRRRRKGFQPYSGGRFIDQVDGLVRQVTVGDIAGGKRHRRLNGFVGDLHLVMGFVFIPQSPENQHRFLRRGFPHHNRLKAPLQSRVLFDVLAVFVDGGGADDLQFPPGQ